MDVWRLSAIIGKEVEAIWPDTQDGWHTLLSNHQPCATTVTPAIGLSSAHYAGRSTEDTLLTVAGCLVSTAATRRTVSWEVEWRSTRSGYVAAALQRGVRLGAVANLADCLYFVALRGQDVGAVDTDDRWSNHLGVLGETTWNWSPPQWNWWWNTSKAHHAIMNDPQVLAETARFLTAP